MFNLELGSLSKGHVGVKRVKASRLVSLISFVIMIIADFLMVMLSDTKEDLVGVYQMGTMLPLSPAFIIWLMILILQYAFVVYQMFPRSFDSEAINKGIAPLFPFLAIAHMVWVFSTDIVIDILMSLVQTGILFLSYSITLKHASPKDSVLVRAWISVYLPWILFSCFSEVAFYSFDLSEVSFEAAAILYAIYSIISLLVAAIGRDPLVGSTVVWISSWLFVAGLYRIHFHLTINDPLILTVMIMGLIHLVVSLALAGAKLRSLLRTSKQPLISQKELA